MFSSPFNTIFLLRDDFHCALPLPSHPHSLSIIGIIIIIIIVIFIVSLSSRVCSINLLFSRCTRANFPQHFPAILYIFQHFCCCCCCMLAMLTAHEREREREEESLSTSKRAEKASLNFAFGALRLLRLVVSVFMNESFTDNNKKSTKKAKIFHIYFPSNRA